MKKIILFGVVLLSSLMVKGQEKNSEGFSKGDFMGSFSLSLGNENEKSLSTKYKYLVLSPTISYFVAEKVCLDLSVSTSNYDWNSDSTKNNKSEISYGLGARYFFKPKNKFSTNLGLNFLMFNSKDETYYDGELDSKTDINGTRLELSYGLNYFISNHFALTLNFAALQYQSSKSDDSSEKDTALYLNIYMSDLKFGLVYKI
jgi:hypothetical protein